MKRILIIRFSSIGDIVLTSPIIRCLKKELKEDVQIDYLTKEQYASILLSNPYLSNVYTIKQSTKEILNVLKTNKYHYIIDLHKNVRSKKIARKLSGDYFTFPKLNKEKWLLTTFKVDKMPSLHIVDRYFKAAEHLNVKNDKRGIDYFIPEKDEVVPSEFFGEKNYIAVAIGAQFLTKQLPLSKLVEILNQVELPVVLLGGKEDAQKGDECIEALPESKVMINMCGVVNLNQSASIIKQAKALLTHDTGLMHIGSAFNIPIVSVWGNTVPKLGMYAYLPQNIENLKIHEVKDLSCRPCSKIGYQKCPKNHFNCMQLQDATAIAKDLNA